MLRFGLFIFHFWCSSIAMTCLCLSMNAFSSVRVCEWVTERRKSKAQEVCCHVFLCHAGWLVGRLVSQSPHVRIIPDLVYTKLQMITMEKSVFWVWSQSELLDYKYHGCTKFISQCPKVWAFYFLKYSEKYTTHCPVCECLFYGSDSWSPEVSLVRSVMSDITFIGKKNQISWFCDDQLEEAV